jgi:hypothetical protein
MAFVKSLDKKETCHPERSEGSLRMDTRLFSRGEHAPQSDKNILPKFRDN